MSDGWIKLHRALLSWEWFTTPNMVHFWIYCLLSASHEPKKYRGIDLVAGQFVSGRKLLSANTGLSEREVRTCIERLKSTNEMTSRSYHDFSVFTIISWEKYQVANSSDQPNDQQATSQRPANDHPTTTIKNERIKERKKDKNNTLEHFVPPTTEEVSNFFSSKYRPQSEAVRFFAFYDSKGWLVGKAKMKNWKSAAIGWIARSKEEQPNTAIAGTQERQPIANGRIEYKSSHKCKYCIAVSLRLGLNVAEADEFDRLIAMSPITIGELDCILTTFKGKPEMIKHWNESPKSPYRGML